MAYLALGLSLYKEEIILDVQLGQGLVFDNEITARADTHPTEARSKAVDNFEEAQR